MNSVFDELDLERLAFILDQGISSMEVTLRLRVCIYYYYDDIDSGFFHDPFTDVVRDMSYYIILCNYHKNYEKYPRPAMGLRCAL